MKRTKTITTLKKVFNEKDLYDCELIPEENLKGYMDPANVMMVVPLTNIGLDILTSNFELGEPQKVVKLDYNTNTLESCSKYSIEYIKIILEFITCFGDDSDDETGVLFKVANEYPMTVELKHFRLILAPRINND